MIDNNDFQKVFSVLHASEATLTEVLNMTVQKKKHSRPFAIVLAAALIICLLATTAVAAPIIYSRITANVRESWDAETPTVEQGNSIKGQVHQITVDVTMSENAPSQIEKFYAPQLSEAYDLTFGYAYAGKNYDQLDAICINWDISENEIQAIRFQQHSAHSYKTDGMGFHVFITNGNDPELIEINLGGVDGYLIQAPDNTVGEQFFCWTNGDYIFQLRFPIRYTQEQMAEIISSVASVENIRPYLVSMTEAEIQKVLDN